MVKVGVSRQLLVLITTKKKNSVSVSFLCGSIETRFPIQCSSPNPLLSVFMTAVYFSSWKQIYTSVGEMWLLCI